MVTSNLVCSELGSLLSYRFGHSTAFSRIDMILKSRICRVVYTSSEVDSSACLWWNRFADKKFSFPDIVSFEFMRRLGIQKVLTFDDDFSNAGFDMVR